MRGIATDGRSHAATFLAALVTFVATLGILAYRGGAVTL